MYACLCIDKSWAVSQTSSEQFTYMSPWDLCLYMSEDSNNARKHFTFCLMCLDIPLTTRCHCTQRTTILEYHYVMGCKMKISDKYIIIIVAISTFIHDGWQQYNIHLLYVYDCYHNGICFNQPYYDLCIPAAKCLMSDLISSFFFIIHVQCDQTVNVFDSHSVIMVLCKDLSYFKSFCCISNGILCNILSFIYTNFTWYMNYIDATRYFVVVSFFSLQAHSMGSWRSCWLSGKWIRTGEREELAVYIGR